MGMTASASSTNYEIFGDENRSNDSVGLSNRQLSPERRQTLDVANHLYSIGVQVDLDLPVISVIGNQSAGKSSLIESISGITFPHAVATCTRCPIECRLSYSDAPWVCEVSPRFVKDHKGRPLKQVRNELFGPRITNRAEVEERIWRAQRAILNPSRPKEEFLLDRDGDPEAMPLAFQSNCVSLQISGKDIADLSFVDLPVLMATGEHTDRNSTLVQNLVTSYIRRESSIILLIVACETVFENQGAHRIVSKYDFEGKRTVGVFTKPDRIQVGEHEQWLPYIRNTKEPLQNNWFCVKQPGLALLRKGITWKEARRDEDHFFRSVAPWSTLDRFYRQFLGTSSSLTEKLSFMLSDLISKRLPKIKKDLDQLILETEESLYQLQRLLSRNAQSQVSHRLRTFTEDLSHHATRISEGHGLLLQRLQPVHDAFDRQVRMTIPPSRPYEHSPWAESNIIPTFSAGGGRVHRPVRLLTDTFEASDDGETSSRHLAYMNRVPIRVRESPRLE